MNARGDEGSPLRARAGVAYAFQQLTNEGRYAFPQEGVVRKSVELLGIEEPVVRAAIDHEVGHGRLVRDRVGDDDCIYLAALHRAGHGEPVAEIGAETNERERHVASTYCD